MHPPTHTGSPFKSKLRQGVVDAVSRESVETPGPGTYDPKLAKAMFRSSTAADGIIYYFLMHKY